MNVGLADSGSVLKWKERTCAELLIIKSYKDLDKIREAIHIFYVVLRFL